MCEIYLLLVRQVDESISKTNQTQPIKTIKGGFQTDTSVDLHNIYYGYKNERGAKKS